MVDKRNSEMKFFCWLLVTSLIAICSAFQLPKCSFLFKSRIYASSGKGGFKSTGNRRPLDKKRSTAPSNNIRQMKVARVLRDELSDIICSGDIKANIYPEDNLLKSVNILNIQLSADLSIAKVLISASGNSVERRQIYVWLNENIGQVRHSLTQRLRTLRRVPTVSFELADTQSAFYLTEVMEILFLTPLQ